MQKKISRILFLAYDLKDNTEFECGKRALTIVEKLKNFKHTHFQIEIQSCNYIIPLKLASKCFHNQYKPDIIIAQQFSIGHARFLCSNLKIPLVLLLHFNCVEYTHFYNEKLNEDSKLSSQYYPFLIFTWTDSLVTQIKNFTKPIDIPIVSLKENQTEDWLSEKCSKFWDLLWYKVSMVIPCHGKHIMYLDSLLDHISHYTEKPYEIVVSVSVDNNFEQTEDTPKTLENLKTKYKCKLNIHFLLSFEGQIAAENRNLGAQNSHGDILLFLDADDIFHPQVIEVIKYIWKIYRPVELHWEFEIVKKKPETFRNVDFQNLEIIPGKRVFEINHPNGTPCFNSLIHPGYCVNPHLMIPMGHFAVERNVWQKHPLPLIIDGEDTLFHRIISYKYPERSIWLKCLLSFYLQQYSLGASKE